MIKENKYLSAYCTLHSYFMTHDQYLQTKIQKLTCIGLKSDGLLSYLASLKRFIMNLTRGIVN